MTRLVFYILATNNIALKPDPKPTNLTYKVGLYNVRPVINIPA